MDQYVKHELKELFYIRYADDFVMLSDDREYLKRQLKHITAFLSQRLRLVLHPRKVSI